jgi:hypothetical protein
MAKPKDRTNDPRVARVMRAIDTVIASPHVEDLMAGVIESLITFGNSCQRHDHRDGWTPANARATIHAYAMNVPEPLLDVLAKVADKEVKWVTSWDRRGWLEAYVPGGSALTLPDLRRAYAARLAESAANAPREAS